MKKNKFIIGILLLALAFLFDYFSPLEQEKQDFIHDDLVIKAFYIGQGDAFLIKSGEDNILIDSGDIATKDEIVQLLEKENVKKISLLVATHPHADHIGGMEEVLKNFKVEKVLDSGQIHTSKTFRNYLSLIKKKGIPFEKAKQGEIYTFDNNVTLEVLWPQDRFLQNTHSDLNNNGIVLRLKKDDFSMLFTADIEKEAERILVRKNKEKLKSNVLKAPHHSSNTSSTNEFLNAVGASDVVISCGINNDYGFPHEKTLARYKKANLNIFNTAENGTITIVTDGKAFEILKKRG